MVKKTDDSCSHSYMPRTGRRTELPWLTELCTDARRIESCTVYCNLALLHTLPSISSLSIIQFVGIYRISEISNKQETLTASIMFLVTITCSVGDSHNFFYLNQNHKSCSKIYLQIQIQIRTCRARLTNCPGALTKCQKAIWSRWDLRSCLNLLVSVMSLMLWGSEFQAAGSA